MHDQTNDPQEEYKREPLLSDEEIHDMWWFGDSTDVRNRPAVPKGEGLLVDDGYEWGAKDVRDFYEAKIASGELMVVKTATINRHEHNGGDECSECQHFFPDYEERPPSLGEFCYCGAKIIEG